MMKKTYYLIFLSLGALIAGVALLRSVGTSFIQEVEQGVSIGGAATSSAEAGIAGIRAPYFELPDLNGGTTKISDFLGSGFVLVFWTSWNTASADQIQILDEYLKENTESLFKIIAVNSQEDKSIVSNFMRRGGYQVKTLLDENGAVGDSYMARNLPAVYFIDKSGIIQDIAIGVLSRKMLVDKANKIIR